MNEQAVANKAGFKLTPFGTGNANAYQVDKYFTFSSDTNTICYDEDGNFTVSFFAQNTEIECGNFQIQYRLVGGDWLDLTESSPNDGVVTATLTGLAIGEYQFRAQWIRTGSQSSCPSSLGDNTGWQVSTDNLIVEECCVFEFDSGYAGNTEGENNGNPSQGFNNAWWYAFDIEGSSVQNVYQNENVIGTATYDAIEGTITISFNSGYSLKDGESKSVKWYTYANGALPTAGRPIPGQAPNSGTSLTIDTNGDRYYVIHLDVQFCSSAD
ncbi:MAG: hypothetical protein Q8S14_13875 [Algoriphagus sp.]|uniref:hypothetical protein n=1 Tax=Algoriphagus sp. TaxID=1872435 RepID=UPI00272045A4|nr:hypothetical protein [Algoriphagus sp.]MDO8968062.1 hypothetical protein [Algoriphagus sp.]MDP2040074.1 hypothetical protein [Algoriphagus sp.]MDP3199134.1 hypothetical protein [Algoriphagus sp.]MDP3472953.1 hypothetical protein [Algoriphagus sp.]